MSHESPALASPPETARALTDALHAAADRARDERVRLARALRLAGRPAPDTHCPADDPAPPAPPQPPTPAAVNAAKLAQHLQQLDAVIRDRLKTLNQTQARIDEGERRLVTLERAIQQATQRFTAHLQQASRLVETQTTTTSSPAASPSGPLPDPAALAQRLDELTRLDKSIDQRVARLQQMHKQAGEIVERVLTHAAGEVEDKAAELAAPIQAEVERLLAQQTKRAEAELARRIAALEEQSRSHLQRQMGRLHEEAIRLTRSAEPPDTAGTIHVPGPEALKPPIHALAQRIKPERDTPSQGAA